MDNCFFHHLVLLVGTNPLPNFVVADYWLKKNPQLRKIWLVYSEENDFQAGTQDQADRLETLLQERWKDHRNLKFPFTKIALKDVSNAAFIHNDIKERMHDELKDGGDIHLNYTGGTKTMSTHVYWNLKEMGNKKKNFSYLDARTFRLISDEGYDIETDLRKEVSLSFDEMIRLHGFERINKPKDFIFYDALGLFQEIIERDQLNEFYGDGGYNREMFLTDNLTLAEKFGKLSESSLKTLEEFKPNSIMTSLIKKMPEDHRLFDMNGQLNKNIANKKFESAVKFLDGDWLERHISKTIQDIFVKDNITIEQNWEIKKPGWTGDLKFELDVVLINGYEMTGISCTTDSKKALCKSKGFEIMHRTRQIGGDESKAVLVTRMNKKNRDLVQQELVHETGGSQGSILVLGEKDLKKESLKNEIQKFVFNQ